MERLQLWGFLCLVVLPVGQSSTNSSDPQASYLLLAPGVLHSGVPLSVSISILIPSQVNVKAHVLHGNQTVASASITVDGGSTQLLHLPPVHESESSYWSPYTLKVEGHVGNIQVFSNSTDLHLAPKDITTFIQTDKVKYLPGQEVKIRVVSIHPDGKPYISRVDVVVTDPSGIQLRQWLSVDSDLGVVAKQFQLSENPPLGQWTIMANVDDMLTKKHFNVTHYVLPKFEVVVNAPDVIHPDDKLMGSVTAKYSHGKPVQGHMSITFHVYHHGIVADYEEEIDGTQSFSFNIPEAYMYGYEEMDYYEEYMMEEFLLIVVNVTDELTGLAYNSTARVSLTRYRYKLSFENHPTFLRPALSFTAMLKISTYNNRPLSAEDEGKVVQVSVIQEKHSPWAWLMENVEEMRLRVSNVSAPPHPHEPEDLEFPLPADGVISLDIPVMHDTQALTIDASLEDSHGSLRLYRTYMSPSDSYLQIHKPAGPTQVGSPLTLPIEKNFPAAEIHYIVTSRGQVVFAGKTSGDLTLLPEISWAPRACIIVFCVHANGEVINDVLHLPISQILQNQVSLSWSDIETSPGEEVTLQVSVEEPQSVVWILVVDKVTQWMASHNDITKKRVMEEHSLSMGEDSSHMFTMGDPYSVFRMCRLVVLTDASLHMMKELLSPELPGTGPDLTHLNDQGTGNQPEPRVRQYFPETWIWLDMTTGDSNTGEITVTVPDSITTWVATAFVMSENLGLGIVHQPAELKVSKNFFLLLNLPAFIIRGEELLLEIILFNNLTLGLQVMVTVAHSDAFEFVFPDNEGLPMSSIRQVSIAGRSSAIVLIPIRPLVLGEIPISVKAVSYAESDSVLRTVLVKAEGLEQMFSSLLLEVSPPQPSVSKHVTFTFPADVVAGSQRVLVTAVGDILGPSISGLESLIQMPCGCGEQNMINFAPNIYVLQYLQATGQDDPETTQRATEYMIKGYERELSYQRKNGSFSAFGKKDSSGSTWLTAFVLKCFLQARPFIYIDNNVLQRAAAWLAGQQGDDGHFEEPGRVIHTELQGGLDGPVSLTAYILIALLEDAAMRAQYGSQVASAKMFLQTRLNLGISSNYSLSLVAYALALADSSGAAVDELLGRAEMKDGVPVWSSSDAGLSSSWQPRSADIEMVSYVLLAMHRLGRGDEDLGLMKWLSQQRNHLGGYGSTQDTIVALQALSTLATHGGFSNYDVTVHVKTHTSTTVATFHILHENYMLQQSQQIEPEEELNLEVIAEGQGLALVQLNVFYNIRTEELTRRRRDADEHEAFHLYVDLMEEDLNSAHLMICTSLSEHLGLNMTGMVIMEVGLLSGFSLAPDGVQLDEVVKKVETLPGKVVLYLDSVTTEWWCVDVHMVMEYKVAKVQEVPVIIYDYYEPRRKTVGMYKSVQRSSTSSCTFCGEDCSKCSGDTGHYEVNAASHSRQNLLLTRSPLTLLLLLLLLNL